MSRVKKAWLAEATDDIYTLCIRTEHHEHVPALLHNRTLVPPQEPVNGKKLDINEAKQQGLLEEVHNLGVFNVWDLEKIRDAINQIIGE
jgi:hypothetical protein